MGPIVRQSVHHAVSPALRDLPTINESQLTVGGQEEAEPVRRIPWSPSVQAPMRAESVLQTTAAGPSPKDASSGKLTLVGSGRAENELNLWRGAPRKNRGIV